MTWRKQPEGLPGNPRAAAPPMLAFRWKLRSHSPALRARGLSFRAAARALNTDTLFKYTGGVF